MNAEVNDGGKKRRNIVTAVCLLFRNLLQVIGAWGSVVVKALRY